MKHSDTSGLAMSGGGWAVYREPGARLGPAQKGAQWLGGGVWWVGGRGAWSTDRGRAARFETRAEAATAARAAGIFQYSVTIVNLSNEGGSE